MKTVIIYAPQGTGKTKHAEALRKHFGCTKVIDGWPGEGAFEPGALHLTNMPVEAMSLEEALRRMDSGDDPVQRMSALLRFAGWLNSRLFSEAACRSCPAPQGREPDPAA